MATYNTICFSILFEDRLNIINKLGSLFFDRKKLKNIKIESMKTTLTEWVDPIYGQLSTFFIGSSILEANSVFLSNSPDGWSTMSRSISRLLGCKCIQIRISNNPKNSIFEYSLIQSGESLRIVQLLQDTKWTFFTEGDPLPYEDLASYENNRISKRFNTELIKNYLKVENIDFDQLFTVEFAGVKYETLSWNFVD